MDVPSISSVDDQKRPSDGLHRANRLTDSKITAIFTSGDNRLAILDRQGFCWTCIHALSAAIAELQVDDRHRPLRIERRHLLHTFQSKNGPRVRG